MSTRRLALLAVALFVAVLLWRLPASWAIRWLPSPLRCDVVTGTIWSGQCGTLQVVNVPLHAVTWQLRPVELLHAKLGIQVQVADPALTGTAKALIGRSGRIQGYDLLAQLPLASGLLPGVPRGWSGQLQLDLPRFEIAAGQLQSVTGVVRLHDLVQLQPRVEYGGFEWTATGGVLQGGRIEGPLRDLGGSLQLKGTLLISLRGEYSLNAMVSPRAGANDPLLQGLEQLGNADAQGFRPLQAVGTL